MNLQIDKIFPCLPRVERGKPLVLGSHPKGGYLLYTNGNSVIIRGTKNSSDNDIYTEHSCKVNCAKYSPSGFYIASGDVSGKVRIWDTTQKEHILKNEYQPFAGPIYDLAWTVDNQRIAVGGQGREKFGAVFLADSGASAGEIMGMNKTINAVDFKTTRPYRLIAGSEDFSVCLFEGPPFKFKKTIQMHTNFVNCARFSSKCDIFVSGSADGKILAFDAGDASFLTEVGSPAHKAGVYGIDFSTSGNRMVSVSADKTVKIWNTENKSFENLGEFAFENHIDNMLLACSWMENQIITVCLSGALSIFDAPDNCSTLSKPTTTYNGHWRPITCTAYSSTVDRLITASCEGRIAAWNAETGVAEIFHGSEAHTNQVQAMAVNDKLVVTVGIDDRLVVSSADELMYSASMKLESQPRAVSMTTKGLTIVICLKHIYLFSITDTSLSKPITVIEVAGEPEAGALSPSGELVAVGLSNGGIALYSTNNGTTLTQLPATERETAGKATSMAFSPDGSLLAAGDIERNVSVFKVEAPSSENPTLTVFNTIPWRGHMARVNCIAWNPDGIHLASGSLDCGIVIWSTATSGKCSDIRNAHPAHQITGLAWTSKDMLMSTGQDAVVRKWKFK